MYGIEEREFLMKKIFVLWKIVSRMVNRWAELRTVRFEMYCEEFVIILRAIF